MSYYQAANSPRDWTLSVDGFRTALIGQNVSKHPSSRFCFGVKMSLKLSTLFSPRTTRYPCPSRSKHQRASLTSSVSRPFFSSSLIGAGTVCRSHLVSPSPLHSTLSRTTATRRFRIYENEPKSNTGHQTLWIDALSQYPQLLNWSLVVGFMSSLHRVCTSANLF
ncbi:hypothetical protein BKA80DRAFT_271807 [Phyllosticta citrichinensis]